MWSWRRRREDDVGKGTYNASPPLVSSSLILQKAPVVAWRRRPRRLTRRRERPVLRGGEGGSIGVVWLVSSTRRRPDLISASSNTILYKIVFIDYMQNIKLLADNS